MSDTIIAFISGSVVATIASCLTHFFSERRERRNRFNKAAEQFKLAFWPEVEFLDKQFLVDRASINATRRSCDVLFNAVNRHQKAVFLFCDYLGCIDKRHLKKAWKEYCKGGCDIKIL